MSKLAKKPIYFKEDIQCQLQNNVIKLTNKNGTLEVKIPSGIIVTIDKEKRHILVNRQSDEKRFRALQGTVWALIRNAVEGLTNKFTRELEIIGIGYNAKMEGKTLVLNMGFSHPVKVPVPSSLEVKCVTPTLISITGVDKQQVGQFAINIKKIRPINVYTLKGIKFKGEQIKQKPGKAVVAGTAGTGGVKK
ncbi:MAG: 50S ribosomal protein L6 [Planctomycetota bacterium]